MTQPVAAEGRAPPAATSPAKTAKDSLRRAAYEAKTVVARYPSLALPIARRRHGIPFGAETEIVIEGFPRSGTSFAVAAFHLAQHRPVNVACHVHAPAQVTAAVKAAVPALVVVREPEDTVLSFVIRNPHLTISQGVRGWLRFYEPLLRHAAAFVVGLFPAVTSDFGEVTRRVNRRFGTSFAEFEHTAENVRRCFREIDGDYERRVGTGPALERIVARPSEYRKEIKERMRGSYRSRSLSRLRSRAEEVYESYTAIEHAGR